MEDQQIVQLLFDRSEQAISEISTKYSVRLKSLAASITCDQSDAEECLNDTFMQAWSRIPPSRPDNLFAYLAKIIRHIALDLCDKKHAQKRSGIVVELSDELQECICAPSDVETEIEDKDLGAAINAFIRTLDDRTQYAFVRRYFYCDPVMIIASSTGKSESYVKSLLFRTRNKLREHLRKEGIEL